MNIIQVNYDLSAPGRDYARVAEYIKGHGAWAKGLESLWFVRTSKSAATVRDELLRIVDANDKVLTLNVTGDDWATYGLPADVNDWLRSNLSGTPSNRILR